MDAAIRQAIAEKRLLEFFYDGYHRIAEPHVYGIKNGKYQLLTYQVRGQSGSAWNLPNWRRFDIDRITGLRVLSEHFLGPRDYSAFEHSDFDLVLVAIR